MLRILSFLLVITAVISETSVAQTSGVMPLEKGTRFMVSFAPVMPSASEEPLPVPLIIRFLSDQAAHVRIRTPNTTDSIDRVDAEFDIVPVTAGSFATGSYSITGNQRRIFSLPGLPQQIKSNAYEVTSDVPISVFALEQWNGNGDHALQIPTWALGTSYHVFSLPSDRYGKTTKYDRGGFALITAVEDGTVVTITPTVSTVGGPDLSAIPRGTSRQVTLKAGQTMYFTNQIDTTKLGNASEDLTGTHITSTKPISVTSGHLKGSVMMMPSILPLTGASADAHFVRSNIHDVLLTDSDADTAFVVVPQSYTARRRTDTAHMDLKLPDSRGDVVRFLAIEDNTAIFRKDTTLNVMKRIATIQKGQVFTDSVFRIAAYFTSNHPILVAQYGKSWAYLVPPVSVDKADGAAQGHPTVEAGMPSLTVVPPVSKWVSSALFSSMPGDDSFLSIAYRTSEVDSIFLDGKRITLSGKRTPIPNTEYSTWTSSLPNTDHSIGSNSRNVRFMAWPHSSNDGLQMGRATATPASMNLALPGADTIVFASGMPLANDILCGDRSEAVTIKGSTGLAMIYSTASTNYSLAVSPFEVGASSASYSLAPINAALKAEAVVRTVTQTGAFAEKKYTYQPDSISVKSLATELKMAVRVPQCVTMTLQNGSSNVISLNGLTHSAKTLTLAPWVGGSRLLAPSADTTVDVCMTSSNIGVIADTIYFDRSCYRQRAVVLNVTTIAPSIAVSDIGFGTVSPFVSPITGSATIINRDVVPLLIDSIAWQKSASDSHFQIDAASMKPLPAIVAAKDSFNVVVQYAPNGDTGVHRASLRIFSNSRSTDSLIQCTATSSIAADIPDRTGAEGSTASIVHLDNAIVLSALPLATVTVYDIHSTVLRTITVPDEGRLVLTPRAMGLTPGFHLILSRSGAHISTRGILVVE